MGRQRYQSSVVLGLPHRVRNDETVSVVGSTRVATRAEKVSAVVFSISITSFQDVGVWFGLPDIWPCLQWQEVQSRRYTLAIGHSGLPPRNRYFPVNPLQSPLQQSQGRTPT